MSSPVAQAFSATIQELVRRSNQRTAYGPFCCRQAPPISLEDYATRIWTFMQASDQAYVVACIYLAQIFKTDKAMISLFSAHKLMITTITVAAKWTDDVYYTNRHYADVGGVPLWELNDLEAKLIGVLGWRVFVHPDVFNGAVQLLTNPSSVSHDLVSLVPEKSISKAPYTPHIGQDTWDREDTSLFSADSSVTTRGVGTGLRQSNSSFEYGPSGVDTFDDGADDLLGDVIDTIAASMQELRDYGKTPLAPHIRPVVPSAVAMQGFSLL